MCRATLLPDPDSPLRMMMRTPQWLSTGHCRRQSRGRAFRGAALPPQRAAPLGGMVIGALFLVFLDAAVQLVREQIDGGVHVFFGGIRVDGAAAHVQRGFGLLAQLLYRQHTVHVDDLIKVSADALELLLDITPQRRGDFDVVTGDAELHGPSPVTSVSVPPAGARSRPRCPSLRSEERRVGKEC